LKQRIVQAFFVLNSLLPHDVFILTDCNLPALQHQKMPYAREDAARKLFYAFACLPEFMTRLIMMGCC